MWSGVETFTESMLLCSLSRSLAPVLVNADVGMRRLDLLNAVQIDVGHGDQFDEWVAADGLDVGPRHTGHTEAGVTEHAAGLRAIRFRVT
jgi:hypothetical protein